AEMAAVDAALNGLARRLRYAQRADGLRTGVSELERSYAAFESNFLAFVPPLRDFAANWSGLAVGTDRSAAAGSRRTRTG
ncbi:MAG TPA: hypothetical protein VI565_05460, partial [Burkholderiales bacterium]|nr:hypothetical protein [Burkholderiales bacterium]